MNWTGYYIKNRVRVPLEIKDLKWDTLVCELTGLCSDGDSIKGTCSKNHDVKFEKIHEDQKAYFSGLLNPSKTEIHGFWGTHPSKVKHKELFKISGKSLTAITKHTRRSTSVARSLDARMTQGITQLFKKKEEVKK
jgi:hypothetical protein